MWVPCGCPEQDAGCPDQHHFQTEFPCPSSLFSRRGESLLRSRKIRPTPILTPSPDESDQPGTRAGMSVDSRSRTLLIGKPMSFHWTEDRGRDDWDQDEGRDEAVIELGVHNNFSVGTQPNTISCPNVDSAIPDGRAHEVGPEWWRRSRERHC